MVLLHVPVRSQTLGHSLRSKLMNSNPKPVSRARQAVTPLAAVAERCGNLKHNHISDIKADHRRRKDNVRTDARIRWAATLSGQLLHWFRCSQARFIAPPQHKMRKETNRRHSGATNASTSCNIHDIADILQNLPDLCHQRVIVDSHLRS